MAELQGEARRRYVGEMFARIAPRYDLMNTPMTLGAHHRWRKPAARLATRGLRGAALDVATGTGDLALALARASGMERVVGLDLLPGMVALARKKALARGLAGRVGFLVGDGLALPFPDGAFACVTSAWGLRNMPDPRASLEEMARVTAAGGRVVSLESVPVRGSPLGPFFRLYFHQVVPLLGQVIAGDREAYTYLPRSVDGFLPAERLAGLFQEVGLADVGYRRLGLGAVAIHWGTRK